MKACLFVLHINIYVRMYEAEHLHRKRAHKTLRALYTDLVDIIHAWISGAHQNDLLRQQAFHEQT